MEDFFGHTSGAAHCGYGVLQRGLSARPRSVVKISGVLAWFVRALLASSLLDEWWQGQPGCPPIVRALRSLTQSARSSASDFNGN